MKLEVSRRRLADPTFNYRKLKQELQSQGQTTVQSQSVAHSGANLPGEGGFSQDFISPGSRSPTNVNPSFRPRSLMNMSNSSPVQGRPFASNQSSAELSGRQGKQQGAARGKGPPLGRGSGTMGSRR